MKLSKTQMLLLFGFLTWLVPFVASFFFFGPASARMTIDNDLFKSIMAVLSALVGTLLLVKYFDSVKKDYMKEGLIVGVVWAVMNWVMDFVVLAPVMKMDTTAYFMSIGLRYLMVPIISVGMAMAIENSSANSARRYAAIENSSANSARRLPMQTAAKKPKARKK